MNQFKMNLKLLIFDLDGTLWNPRETIILNQFRSVYVGTTQTDLNAAAKNDLDFIFCSYGFGHLNVSDYPMTINSFDKLEFHI